MDKEPSKSKNLQWVNRGWTPGAHQAARSLPLLSWTGERKIKQKAHGSR